RFVTDLSGTLERLFSPAYAPYFTGTSRLVIDALRDGDGSIAIQRAEIVSGVASLDITATLAPDFFPTAIAVDGSLTAGADETIPLPGAAETASIRSARFTVDFGGAGERWTARFDLTGLDTETIDAGVAEIVAEGTATALQDPAARAVTATLSGSLEGVTAADPALARALGDRFDIAAEAAWTAGQPVAVEIAEIKNPNAAIHFTGVIDGLDLDGRIWLNTADIAPFASLAGQPLSGALTFEARGTIGAGTGSFDLTFDADGEDLAVGTPQVDALLAGRSRLTGNAARTTEGLRFDALTVATDQVQARIDGSFDLGAVDLAVAAAIEDVALLTEAASGGIALEARVTGSGVQPQISAAVTSPILTLTGRRLTEGRIGFDGVVDTTTNAVDGETRVAGFLDGVAIDGSARIASLADGARRIADLVFTAAGTRAAGDLTLTAGGLATGRLSVASPDVAAVAPLALVEASGALDAEVTLDASDGTQSVDLLATARNLRVETVSVGEATADVSIDDLFGVPRVDGRVAATAAVVGGTRIEVLQATAAHAAGATRFDLGATLEAGSLAATGALTAVEGGYDVALESFRLDRSADVSAELVEPVTVAVRERAVSIPQATIAVGSGRITAEGTVGDALDLRLAIDRLPLSLANAVQPDLGAAGTLSGTVTVAGSTAAPTATYDVRATGVSAAALRQAGVPDLAVEASGGYAADAVTLDATATGGGLSLTASGRVPLGGGALDLAVAGDVPLGLADPFLAERGARLSGAASVQLQVGGPLSQPTVAGSIAVDGASFVDPQTATSLSAISVRVTLDGQRANIERISGVLGGRGQITVTGSIGIAPGSGFPADLAIVVDDARLTDGRIVTADVDGRLQVTGSLVGAPTVSGEIRVDRAEITVPETLPGGASFLDVRHRLPPPNVARTLERVRRTVEQADTGSGASSGLILDVTIVAPSQIFVRGRGIDAELGGSVRITGPITDVQPVGAFDLIRGRVSVIGQRINFDRGTLTLVGDLDPVLDFVASTRTNSITVMAQITGVASDPQIVLSSVPELPQDEVLAQLLFGRSLNDLSPLQIASLAVAVAELAGAGGGPGILDQLRQSTGLDDLEIVTDSDGNAAVQAGSYLTENVYLGVTAGAGGQADVSVNLDLTDDLKAKIGVGAEGDSRIGIFFETEY
ncbi:MAG TPA: translocation/assembly module TamB domain-containing protein, partial [Methylomirabilota bacterium]|nr:translocation/assembly module TamB domain-containing protein [Methylomirabilota bacterium]